MRERGGHGIYFIREMIGFAGRRYFDAREPVFLEPFFVLKRDDGHLTLRLRNVLVVRREGSKELFALLGQLLVGFINREVKIGSQERVAPRFAYFEMIAEGVVVPREHEYNDRSEYSENTQSEDRLGCFRVEDGGFKFHIYDLLIDDLRLIDDLSLLTEEALN